MNSSQIDTVLGYLCSMLSPDQQAELDQLLGAGTDVPDVVGDALKGKIAADRMPPRIKRAVEHRRVHGTKPQADTQSFDQMFPNASRLGRA